MMRRLAWMAALLLTASGAAAATLDDVRARGQLSCGVSDGLPGFSSRSADGKWAGFDVDFCRAVATVALGDPDKVSYVSLSAAERFEALRARRIDLLSRNSTWTMSRDVGLGLDFAGVAFYDGQGFMVRADEGVTNPVQLQGGRVCVLGDTTTEQNAVAYFAARKVTVEFLRYRTRPEARAAYAEEKCDAYTADRSALAAERSLLPVPDDHVLLKEVISKEPLGPVTREGDPAWTDLVRWTLYGMINAEERGFSQEKLVGTSAEAVARRGEVSALGRPAAAPLRIADDWLAVVVSRVGNYSDIFDRNLGEDSPLAIDRGINALWNAGGILYAPPMQ